MLQLLLGFNLAIIISALAYGFSALTLYGSVAASILGFAVFGFGGLEWAIPLLVFFISSSALSRVSVKRKTGLEEQFSKGSRRDAGQVMANGGLAGTMVLLHALFPASPWPWIGFTGALAAANADTWATELGVLSPSLPRLITTGKVVDRGTSGGISRTGLLAALAGALLLGVIAAFLYPGSPVFSLTGGGYQFQPIIETLRHTLVIALSGLAGSLVDSWLGASVQAIYECPSCHKETERYPFHSCGTLTIRVRGLPWLNNDWVNFGCTLTGTIVALVLFAFV